MIARPSLTKAECKLLDLGITEPGAIDVEAIAWVDGIKVQYGDLSGCEARLVGYGDQGIVTIQKGSDERRMRFSIAHELGHWNYHRGQSFSCRADDWVEGYSTKPIIEQEADEYAANLLMPAFMFNPLARAIKRPNFDSVMDLASLFKTSLTATTIRLVESNTWPLILVSHNAKGLAWFKRSKDIPDRWFPQKNLDSDSIAYDRLFANKERVRSQVIGAEAWFDSRGAERFDIVEDAIRISSSQVLTLLWIENNEMLEDKVR